MDELNEEESALVAVVREFVDREVRPVVRELEHANTYPEKLIEQSGSASTGSRSRSRGATAASPRPATPRSPRSWRAAG